MRSSIIGSRGVSGLAGPAGWIVVLALAAAAPGCNRSPGPGQIPTFEVRQGELRIGVTESRELKDKQSIVIFSPRTRYASASATRKPSSR